MAYTALQLITNSFFLSQILSKQLQTLTGEQAADGLQLLQDLINFKSTDIRLIPYYTPYTFSFVGGQESYTIPNLLSIDTFTFNIGPVRYSMRETTRFQYFEQYRIDNVQSLPYQYRLERNLDGSTVYVYFVPDQAYVANIWGKFALPAITALTQDLSLTYDLFYIEYLRLSLANYICQLYGATLPDLIQKQLAILEKKLMEVSPSDLSIQKQSYFGRGANLDWQLINIPGWTPY